MKPKYEFLISKGTIIFYKYILKIDSKILSLSPSFIVKRSVLFGQESDNKTLCMSYAKPSWRHPKELKYTAVIAQNQKQKVITNLH